MRPMMSAKLTPLAATRIRTSPALGSGSGASLISRTSGGPARVIHICRMASSLPYVGCSPNAAPRYQRWGLDGRERAQAGPRDFACRIIHVNLAKRRGDDRMADWAIRSAAGFFAAAVILGGSINTITPAAAEKVLRIANMAEPETLDPHRTSTVPESNILRNVFEGLMVLDPSGNVAPGVAESASVSEDGLTYTFRLRDNAKWSNGEPVTAGDFVYSLRRIEDPKTRSQYAEVLYPIKNAEEVNTGKAALTELGVAAPDARTVEISLKAPTPYFLQLLTHTSSLPVNEKAIARFGEEWLTPGKMVSNGAYMLDDVKPNSHVRIVKNPNYWDAARVAIDAVVFDPSEDLAALLKRYRAGEFDVLRDLPSDQLGWL